MADWLGADMSEPICAISACGKLSRKRGWCYTHYSRWYRHGDPEFFEPRKSRTIGVEPCTIDGCDGKLFGRGWCAMHWSRWRQNGDPLALQRIRGDLTARFWSKISKTDTCWLWTGTLDTKGYGQFWDGQVIARAPRFAYEFLVDAIPEGLTIDHLCRVVACVNPAHLEPVTSEENTRRMHEARGHKPSLPEVSACQ
jgi:hypothetical protein